MTEAELFGLTNDARFPVVKIYNEYNEYNEYKQAFAHPMNPGRTAFVTYSLAECKIHVEVYGNGRNKLNADFPLNYSNAEKIFKLCRAWVMIGNSKLNLGFLTR